MIFPQYGLASHKGYFTPEHLRALAEHGPTSLHRFSFEPVRDSCRHLLWAGYPEQTELFPAEEAAAWN
jgi:ribonuclease HII